jgi:hypothetical protein
MKKIKSGLVSLCAGVLLVTSATAQEELSAIVSQRFLNRWLDRQFDLSFRRAGVEVLGMGGAGLATSHSLASALWNPGGLAQLEGLSFAFSGSFNLNTQEVELQPLSGMKIVSEIEPRFLPTFAGAAYSLKLGSRRLTFAAAYHRVSPLAQKITDTFYIYPAGTLDEIESPRGSLYAIVPAMAFELIPAVSLGVSFHIWRGNSQYQLELKSPFLDEFVFFAFKDRESYEGSFANVGVWARPTNWLALGATLTPAWQFTVVEEQESRFSATEVSTGSSGTTGEGETIETPAAELDELKLDIPFFYSVGLAVNPMSKLTLACDFEARRWSKAKQTSGGATTAAGLLNGNAIHLGLEYRATTRWAEFPMRFGYYTDPSPYKDRYFQGQYLGEQIKAEAFTFGLGLRKQPWTFDMAVELGKKEMDFWLDSGDFYNDRLSSTKERFNEVSISFGYHFK